jgi:hypothetical protein
MIRMIRIPQPWSGLVLLLAVGCQSIEEGPELRIISQELVVHADPDRSRLLVACRVHASHSEPEPQSHLVFALSPDHPVALTMVRDANERRVSEHAIRVPFEGAAGYYTVLPVDLREMLPPDQEIELNFEYSIDLSPGLQDGELVAREIDVISPIGEADLRRLLGGVPARVFPYTMEAHACAPPPQDSERATWIAMGAGTRREAESPSMLQTYHAREPRAAVALAYGPYRAKRAEAGAAVELATLPSMSNERAQRLLAVITTLEQGLMQLIPAPGSGEPLRVVPVPGEAAFASGRTVFVPRAGLLAQDVESPPVLELLAINLARAHLLARGLYLGPSEALLDEGAARYLALLALQKSYRAAAHAIEFEYRRRNESLSKVEEDPVLGEPDLGSPNARRAYGEKLALSFALLDEELKPDGSSRPVLKRLNALTAGEQVGSVRDFLATLEPAPSPALEAQLLNGRGVEHIAYSFTIVDEGRMYRTQVRVSSERDGAFHVPLRIWSPFSTTLTRVVPGRTPSTVEVETAFEPVAVLIDPFYWPLDVEMRASATGDRTAGANLAAQCVAAHGGSRLTTFASMPLSGRGTLYNPQDRRIEVSGLDFSKVDGKLLVFGASQDGEPARVIEEGPELYLGALAAMASGDDKPDLLRDTGARAVIELIASDLLRARIVIDPATKLMRRVTWFDQHGGLVGDLQIETYQRAEGLEYPAQLTVTQDGRHAPWLSFRGELVRTQRP